VNVWEGMGRIAHAREQITMAQKKVSELWQWVSGREQLREQMESVLLSEAERCDEAIEQLEVAIHDLQVLRDELKASR